MVSSTIRLLSFWFSRTTVASRLAFTTSSACGDRSTPARLPMRFFTCWMPA